MGAGFYPSARASRIALFMRGASLRCHPDKERRRLRRTKKGGRRPGSLRFTGIRRGRRQTPRRQLLAMRKRREFPSNREALSPGGDLSLNGSALNVNQERGFGEKVLR